LRRFTVFTDAQNAFIFLANPVKYIGDDENNVKGIELVRMKLGQPDESGRRSPIPIKESNFTLEIDSVIIAIGTDANPLIPDTTKDIKTNRWGYIITDSEGRTSKKGVYAGGDIVTGSATVIEAMGTGKRIAQVINEDLRRKRGH